MTLAMPIQLTTNVSIAKMRSSSSGSFQLLSDARWAAGAGSMLAHPRWLCASALARTISSV
jgi:hypothetical protein